MSIGALGTGNRSRSGPDSAIQGPYHPSSSGLLRQVGPYQTAALLYIQPTISQGIRGRWPTPSEWGRQTEPYQGLGTGRHQSCLHQLKHAILSMTQGVVGVLAKLPKYMVCFSLFHTYSLPYQAVYPKAPFPWAMFCLN